MVGLLGLGLWHMAINATGQSDRLWEGFGLLGVILMALIAVSGLALTRLGKVDLS
jgi:hypothetical protein